MHHPFRGFRYGFRPGHRSRTRPHFLRRHLGIAARSHPIGGASPLSRSPPTVRIGTALPSITHLIRTSQLTSHHEICLQKRTPPRPRHRHLIDPRRLVRRTMPTHRRKHLAKNLPPPDRCRRTRRDRAAGAPRCRARLHLRNPSVPPRRTFHSTSSHHRNRDVLLLAQPNRRQSKRHPPHPHHHLGGFALPRRCRPPPQKAR